MNKKQLVSGTLVVAMAVAFVGSGVASAHEIDESRYEARAESRAAKLAELVESGRISQEQADEKLAKMADRHAMRLAVHEAIEGSDYATWASLTEGKRIAEKITDEAGFLRLVEAHDLRTAGDREGARAILEELGIDKPHKAKHRGGFERGARN